MNRCPITYDLCGEKRYSDQGLRILSPGLKSLEPLAYSAEGLRQEAMLRASKLSIQGVQPKLSAILNIKSGCFDLVDNNGKYILKPPHQYYSELPENEDLTMRIAATIGIEVPVHGLVYSLDGSRTYFIKRFDRRGQKDKIAVEDFAQLAGMSRETKYNYTMEKLVRLIDDYCTFPIIEKAKLFRLVIFNFLVGNEDMHLKNYSVISRDNKVELSPAYDLLNTTIVVRGDVEEIALSLKGKKKNLDKDILVGYLGKERCSLPDKVIDKIVGAIQTTLPTWFNLIDISFLSEPMKGRYKALLEERMKVLGI